MFLSMRLLTVRANPHPALLQLLDPRLCREVVQCVEWMKVQTFHHIRLRRTRLERRSSTRPRQFLQRQILLFQKSTSHRDRIWALTGTNRAPWTQENVSVTRMPIGTAASPTIRPVQTNSLLQSSHLAQRAPALFLGRTRPRIVLPTITPQRARSLRAPGMAPSPCRSSNTTTSNHRLRNVWPVCPTRMAGHTLNLTCSRQHTLGGISHRTQRSEEAPCRARTRLIPPCLIVVDRRVSFLVHTFEHRQQTRVNLPMPDSRAIWSF